VRPEALKLPEGNIGKTHQDIGISHGFLNRIPKSQEIEANIDKLDSIK
jgi:hypothetical protein